MIPSFTIQANSTWETEPLRFAEVYRQDLNLTKPSDDIQQDSPRIHKHI